MECLFCAWDRRMPASGKKSLVWVYENDEEDKDSCKPEQQSGSLQVIRYSPSKVPKESDPSEHWSHPLPLREDRREWRVVFCIKFENVRKLLFYPGASTPLCHSALFFVQSFLLSTTYQAFNQMPQNNFWFLPLYSVQGYRNHTFQNVLKPIWGCIRPFTHFGCF